jgi:hypothetical protein
MNGQARVVSLEGQKPRAAEQVGLFEDELLKLDDFNTVKTGAAERTLRCTLSEMDELTAEARWEDLLALFHPVEEKVPELVDCQLDLEVRSRVAFALGQVKRFDEAIESLKVCVARDPDNFLYHSSLAYTAYNSLYAARNREIFLSGGPRRERVELAGWFGSRLLREVSLCQWLKSSSPSISKTTIAFAGILSPSSSFSIR